MYIAGLALMTDQLSNSLTSGKLIGALMGGVIVAAGIAKCIAIARRPATSGKCAYSLLITLAVFLLGYASQIARGVTTIPLIFSLLLAAATTILLTVAIVLAILGLIEYRHHPEFTQGKSQAIWALVLSGIFATLMIVGLVAGIRGNTRLPAGGQVSKGQTEAFDDFNFKFAMPRHPWVRMSKGAVNPAAILTLMRSNPQVLFMIIAEKVGVLIENTDALVELSKANIKSVSSEFKIIDEGPHRVNGIDGIRIRSEATINGQVVFYVHWVAVRNGYAYQLITGGIATARNTINADSEAMLSGFNQVDPARRHSNTDIEFGNFVSKLYGYSIDLQGVSWMRWKDFQTDNPEADCGGLTKGNQCAFLMVPLLCGPEIPAMDALAFAFLGQQGVKAQEQQIRGIINGDEQGMKTRSFVIDRNVEGTSYRYHARIWAAPRCSYFLWLWVPEEMKEEEATRLWESVVSRVRFDSERRLKLEMMALKGTPAKPHAYLLNQMGIYFLKAESYAPAIEYFKRATALHPDDSVYFCNVMFAMASMGRHRDAIEYYSSAATNQRAMPAIKASYAGSLLQTGRREEAGTIFAELFADGHGDLSDLESYATSLADINRWGDFDKAFADFRKRDHTTKPLLAQVKILADHQKHTDAVRLLKAELAGGVAMRPEIGFEMIRNHNAMEQFAESVAICDTLISNGYSSVDVFYSKAQAECELQWYRRAKESLEAGLKRSPNDKDIKEFLTRVSGFLGEGDNSSIKDEVPPVPLPEALRARIPTLQAPMPGGGYNAFVLNNIFGYQFERGKEERMTRYLRVKVLDAGGVSRYSTINVDFDPLNEKVYVNRLVVRDTNGVTLHTGNPSDYYVVNKNPYGMVTHDKTLCIPVANLAPGNTIDLTVTKKTFGHPEEFAFRRRYMVSDRPSLLEAVFYCGDATQITCMAFNQVQTQKVDNAIIWSPLKTIPYKWEASEPNLQETVPTILLSDSSLTWDRVAAKYLQSLDDRLVMKDGVRRLAEELTRGARTNEERMERIFRHVQKEYTYRALEFGIRGRLPAPAEETIRNKYGDCKDHAMLAFHLLKAAGIPAILALANTSDTIEESLPSLDQFNHMILYLPAKSGCRFVDLTQKDYDAARSVPDSLANKKALLLDQGKMRFETIPAYRIEDCRVAVVSDIGIGQDRAIRVRDSVTLSGYYAAGFRNLLKEMDASSHREWMQNFLRRYEEFAEVSSFKPINVDDTTTNLILETEYVIKDRCRQADAETVFQIPNPWLRHYAGINQNSQRTKPYRIEYPFDMTVATTIHAPAGNRFHTRQFSDEQHAALVAWNARVQQDPETCTSTLAYRLMPGTMGADQFDQWQRTVEKAVRTAAQDVRYRADGAVSPRP